MAYRCRPHNKLVGDGPGLRCYDRVCQEEASRVAQVEPSLKLITNPAVERAAKVERKAERLAQAFVPGASTDQPVLRRGGRGAGRRFTKATAASAAVARAQRLAPEQRQDIARRAAASRWGGKGTK